MDMYQGTLTVTKLAGFYTHAFATWARLTARGPRRRKPKVTSGSRSVSRFHQFPTPFTSSSQVCNLPWNYVPSHAINPPGPDSRTPGNGRGGLILKRHLLSGQRFCRFVRIAPGFREIFQKLLSGSPYLACFLPKKFQDLRYLEKLIFVRIGNPVVSKKKIKILSGSAPGLSSKLIPCPQLHYIRNRNYQQKYFVSAFIVDRFLAKSSSPRCSTVASRKQRRTNVKRAAT